MQLPRLTLMQSRLLASAIATSLAIVLWTCFQPHSFAYAAEIPVPPDFVTHSEFEPSIAEALRNAPAIDVQGNIIERGEDDGSYAPDFAYFDRSLIGRQAEEVQNMTGNVPVDVELRPNVTAFFRFEGGSRSKRARSLHDEPLEEAIKENISERDALKHGNEDDDEATSEDGALVKRQSGGTVWVSANTCMQPAPTVLLITDPVPQLTLHVSSTETKPGPKTPNTDSFPFIGGYVNYTTNSTSDLFMGVSAPALTEGWDGSWSFQIAVSTDGEYYHNYNDTADFIYMIDTDSNSAIFVSYNLSDSNSTQSAEKWETNNFTLYTFARDGWSNMMGLERSYCGLKSQFDRNNISVTNSVTTKYGGGFPKVMFNVQGLDANTAYWGFLAAGSNGTDALQLPNDGGTIRKGGQVFKKFEWDTKVGDSCQVIFDLPFCSDVAYAVPSSTTFKNNDSALISLYDDLAKAYYQNFTNSLDQIACDTTSTAQYSLARNCTDCRNDYKAWLCSVVIPRCEDFSADGYWLQDRNINAPLANGSLPYAYNMTKEFNTTYRERFAFNQSRLPMIDEVIQPGPYKEVLPCDFLCWNIVRSCPAMLGFACPQPPNDQWTYGSSNGSTEATLNLTCNFPGAVVRLNPSGDGNRVLGVSMGMLGMIVAATVVLGGM